MEQELIDSDPQEFDCATCDVADRLRGLDEPNTQAWELYRRCCNRFTSDLQAGGVVLGRLTQEMDADTFIDQMDRLQVIYDVIQPPKDK